MERDLAVAWRPFLLRSLLFFAPLLAVFGAVTAALVVSEETLAVDVPAAVRAQQSAGPERLYGPAYSDCTSYLKLESIRRVRSSVLVVGTSRSMQIRRELFDVTFYNAGGAIARASELEPLLRHIDSDARPELVLLPLDQFFVVAASDAALAEAYESIDARLTGCEAPATLVLGSWQKLLRDLVRKKVTSRALRDPPFPHAIGLRGQMTGSGFRRDGSQSIGTEGITPLSDVIGRMERGTRPFQWSSSISPALVAQIARFLSTARSMGIEVIGFLPPYAPSIYDRLVGSEHYGYFAEVYPALRAEFERQGSVLYDYGDVRTLGLTDEAFLDGFHGSERVYAAIVLDIARRNPRLGRVVSEERIEQMLRDSSDPRAIVPDRR